MFEIFYSKHVIDKLEQIKSNNLWRRMFNDFETQIETNPFTITYLDKEIPAKVRIPAKVINQYHYVELNSKVRVLYHICEMDSSVEICMIEIDE